MPFCDTSEAEFGLLTQGKFPVAQWSAGLGSGEDLECMEEV